MRFTSIFFLILSLGLLSGCMDSFINVSGHVYLDEGIRPRTQEDVPPMGIPGVRVLVYEIRESYRVLLDETYTDEEGYFSDFTMVEKYGAEGYELYIEKPGFKPLKKPLGPWRNDFKVLTFLEPEKPIK